MSKAKNEIDFNDYLFLKKNFLRFWVIFVLKNSLKNRRYFKNQYHSEHLQTSDLNFINKFISGPIQKNFYKKIQIALI